MHRAKAVPVTQADIHVAAALIGETYDLAGPCIISIRDGVISGIEQTTLIPHRQMLAIPSLVDAHNHGRPLSTTSFGCGGKPLELWLPQLATIPSVDPYTAAAASFSRSLKGGATAIMVHLTRAMGLTTLPEEAREIARAARDVGVHIGFAISMRDRNPLIYGDHQQVLKTLSSEQRQLVEDTWLAPLPAIQDQLDLVDAVADAVADASDYVNVQYGPTGVQWCSDELLAAIADRSRQTGRHVHMHLLETQPQRQWADQTYPDGIVNKLADLGLLSPRLTLAHCVWARPDELKQIARHSARIAVNVSSNLHLYSGIADVRAMLGAGINVGMGLDGCALDEDDDGLRELRLFHLLNHSRGFQEDGLDWVQALRCACANGRHSVGLGPGGYLAPGMPADLLCLDLQALNRDGIMDVDPRQLLFARGTRAHITDIYAKGRKIVENGTVSGVAADDLEQELRQTFRAALADKAVLREAWPHIEPAISEHYKGCC